MTHTSDNPAKNVYVKYYTGAVTSALFFFSSILILSLFISL